MLKCCKIDLFVILWLAFKIIMDIVTLVLLYQMRHEINPVVMCWIPFKVLMDVITFIVLFKLSFHISE